MSTIGTESIQHGAPTVAGPNGPPLAPSEKPRKSILGRIVLVLFLGGAAGVAYRAYSVGIGGVQRDFDRVLNYVRKSEPESPESTPGRKPKEPKPYPLWDGLVKLDLEEAKNIGLLVRTVESQVDPIKLELPGRTAYDPNSLNKIRPRFDTLVEKVHVELGQKVKKGQPLLDLFSTDLAAAKNDFQTAYVQWQHDLTLRIAKEDLRKTDTISAQNLTDARNDENKSRLVVTTARQKLVVFGVPEDQIDPLVKNLNPTDLPAADVIHSVLGKAKMTRLSPVDGIVVMRDVVTGNLYDTTDVLMVIAPLEHLIVWLNVYEADQAQVKVGQHLEIRFPYMDRMILGTVQYVATEVSKETRTVSIRASIPNVNGELKAAMLVRASLDIPPVNTQTVIPRSAVVVMNGHEYAFVRKSPTDSKDEQFERRELVIAEERSDHVVIASGVKAREEVASRGSLILAQLYEDQQTVATGMPLE
jgi:multidrug efflux pump subunit AcrA (membrane-fusion protein)